MFLWSLACIIVGLYYTVPAVQGGLNELAKVKLRWGLLFIIPSQIFAAVFVPLVLQRFQTGGHRRIRAAQLPALFALYALMGVLNDRFYWLLAHFFGDSPKFSVIFCKVLLDQLVYTPVISNPLAVVTFAFADSGYSWPRTREILGPRWYWTKVLPVFAMALTIWTPAVTLMYALPLTLQYPFQVFVQCFWGLLLVFLTGQKEE